jgi:hypothetical protein
VAASAQGPAYALGRAALGAGLVLAPERLGRPWLGSAAGTPGGQAVLRGLGIRDLALGLLLLRSLGDRDAAPAIARACALSDGVDATATVLARRAIPATGWGVVALAAGGAVAGLRLAGALGR